MKKCIPFAIIKELFEGTALQIAEIRTLPNRYQLLFKTLQSIYPSID